ncbi:protein ZGRF1 isoform X3 [Nannospalax galili]|uniref:protein ZGRF1 isoform X3 n=1 Tax=Nannospalax galili TaxID=1026970 RepID=UPI00111C3410|nr:protein ZGRF1 isoform X3 [Nannospalax galili]
MESQEFIVLYTHQKMKKSKVWQDGILKITRSGNKATLYDDSGACLESLFLKCFQVKPGDDLESDRYLITVEEVRTNGIVAGTQDSTKERLESSSGWRLSSGRSLGCQPCGLKRKVTGFQGPRKSHKKMVVTENGELAASHGDVTPCSTFSPPLYSKLPMFSVLGKKDINHMPTDAETIITDRNRGRSDVLSSLLSTSSFKMNSEPRDEQEYFCSLVSSRSQHSESLLINETIQRNSLPSHCLGVSPNLRSKEQILALLKSKPASMQKDLNSEITGNFPQMKPQGSSKIITKPKEKCADTQNTGNLHSELQPENATRNTSRWALYLPSQSSPECFAVDGNGTESKFEAQDDMKNLNMTELLVPKKVQLFETCAEKGACSEDKPVDNNSQSRNQDINIDIPLFCESSSSLVSCSSTKNTDLLLETDIQNNNRAPCNQNDKVCIEGLACIREKIHMANRCGTLERECRPVSSLPKIEDTQIESSLSSNSRISDIADMISKSSTDRECLNSIHEPSLPFLEVSFNLSNFETSDTDEESREDKKIFQAAESWEKEVLLANSNSCVLKSCEGKYCQEIAGKHLPLLAFSGVKPEEVFPTKENLMSEFCDRTCVGFNPGHCEDGNLGKAVEEQCGNSKSSLDLTLECTDVPMDNKERVDNPIKTIGINYGIASPANESKGKKPFDTVSEAIPKCHLQQDFEQVISPEQWSPVSTFSFNLRNEDSVLEFSEESLKGRAFSGLKKNGLLENRNLENFPSVSRASAPLVPADGPAVLDSSSFVIDHNTQESSGSSMFTLCEESVLPCGFGPKDLSGTSSFQESREVTLGGDALLLKKSTQSKWIKYQNISQCNLTALNRVDDKVTDDLFAKDVSEVHFSHSSEGQSAARNENSLDSVYLEMIKGMLYQQKQNFSSQDLVSKQKALFCNLKQISKTEETQNVLGRSASCKSYSVKDLQEINSSELCFPSRQKIKSAYLPQRQIHIPAVFQSPTHYKQIFTSSIIEHLNILLFGLAQRLYKALSKLDMSFYTSSKGETLENIENNSPFCQHNQPTKLVMVKKDGPNKGRLFYTCDRPKGDQCKFFKWLEEATPGWLAKGESQPSMVLSDTKSIGLYLRNQKVPVYEECQLLVRKGFDFQRKQYSKLKKFAAVNPEFYSEAKSKIYLKLSRKESSSIYSKGDLWVISKTLDFELDTFIACSAFFGPSSINEVELLPLKGYFPSNWPTNTTVHALLVGNASTELTTLKNIQDYFNPATLPLMPYLLTMSLSPTVSNKNVSKKKFITPAFANIKTKFELLNLKATLKLASELVETHKLNKDQSAALIQIAQMMAHSKRGEEATENHVHSLPITVIHGVFGAGKSYLLAVVILFFVQLFEKIDVLTFGNARPWKLLISSSTNVAVDRVLLGLLSLGFEKFVRVGSIRKIAKPILPYSLHAGSENENEHLKELHALMKENLSPMERVFVRRSIEQHKLGTNRTLLKQVQVVGVTCAACPFPCMNGLKFPVVVLDECSQMTEPAALLPIARFECEKLILVGDPKQLPPAIQGSDSAHENGLEQTLFDRLCLMGHKPVLLRTQYRCHPAISAIANDLFYEGSLINGISERERSPLLEWLPTLCFYNVMGVEQVERDNSFHNVAEAAFTLKLIQSLIASGIAGSMIGVITLYRSQMYKFCHLLHAVDFDHPDIKTVQVSTVDAFQGAEKEIIILSCVRTRQVGFIDSEERMNVALTRGRRHLLIVGNLACLRKNRLWGRVIQHCEGRGDGLQHASQYEPQLNKLLKDYFEKQAEEKQKKKNDKSEERPH